MSTQPQRVNEDHFSTEKFPTVIAFCDRDDNTHIQNGSEESFDYLLKGQLQYRLKKIAAQWEFMVMDENRVTRVSTGKNLGLVLMQALRFVPADRAKQEQRVNVFIPVKKADVEKSLALMYYYGGYPGNFLESTPEMDIILEKFIDPELAFVSYSYVPVQYIEWLRNVLKENGVLEEGSSRTLWVYKK